MMTNQNGTGGQTPMPCKDMKTGCVTEIGCIFMVSGTKLVRAWRGKTHIVLVLENGFEHQGKRYTSLTRIAEQVTGAHWSGPRFFGVIKPRPATPSSEARNGS